MITPVGHVAALVLGFVGGGPGLLPVVPWAGLIREPPAPRAAGSGQRASPGGRVARHSLSSAGKHSSPLLSREAEKARKGGVPRGSSPGGGAT